MTFESLAIRHQHTKLARVLFTVLKLAVVGAMIALLAAGPELDDASLGIAFTSALSCAALLVGALWARGGLKGKRGRVQIADDAMALRTGRRRSVVRVDDIAAGIA